MGSMTWWQLILSIVLSLLFAPHIYSLALLPSQNLTFGRPEWPDNAPRLPWKDQRCSSPRFPNTHLTFTFGSPLTREGISTTTREAEEFIRHVISERMGSKPIPSPHGLDLAWNQHFNMVISVRPYKKYPWSRNRFSVFQASDAEQLVEHCGLQSGRYEEIWAFAFHGREQIGYIWLAREEPVMNGGGGGTMADTQAL